MKHIIRTTTGTLVAGIIAAGCSTTPPASETAAANTAISNASQVIDRAASDPQVAKYASSELDRARSSLGNAQATWQKKHDLTTTQHLAYLAQQRASTAQELASERAAEESMRHTVAERDHAVTAAVSRAATARSARHAQVAYGDLETKATDRGTVVMLPQARFTSGEAKLPAGTRRQIHELASLMKNNPDRKVVIEGYTDNVGTPEYNATLARERAESVRNALVREGVDRIRIVLRSFGEDHPLASNDTSQGRRENRRVEAILADTNTPVPEPATGGTMSGQSGTGGSGQSGH